MPGYTIFRNIAEVNAFFGLGSKRSANPVEPCLSVAAKRRKRAKANKRSYEDSFQNGLLSLQEENAVLRNIIEELQRELFGPENKKRLCFSPGMEHQCFRVWSDDFRNSRES